MSDGQLPSGSQPGDGGYRTKNPAANGAAPVGDVVQVLAAASASGLLTVQNWADVYTKAGVDALIAGIDTSVDWGDIGGVLADQTDLQAALDAKAAASHTHGASDIVSGTIATARLGSGTANSGTYLRGDQTWATVSAGIGGSTGATDRAILIANGTDGATAQASSATIDANGVATVNFNGAVSTTGLAIRDYTVGTTYWTIGADILASGSKVHIQSTGIISLGGGYVFVQGGATFSGVKSYLELFLSPGALGGGGSYVEINNGTAAQYRDMRLRTSLASGPCRLGLYTFATVPAASSYPGYNLTISDRAYRSAYSDGTNWRFLADDAIIS